MPSSPILLTNVTGYSNKLKNRFGFDIAWILVFLYYFFKICVNSNFLFKLGQNYRN